MLGKHAVLEEGLAVQLLFNDFGLLLSEVGQLAEGVLVNPTTLHHVLGELNKSHDVLGSDAFGRAAHLEHLRECHGLGEQDVEEAGEGPQDLLKVVADALVLEVRVLKKVVHIPH